MIECDFKGLMRVAASAAAGVGSHEKARRAPRADRASRLRYIQPPARVGELRKASQPVTVLRLVTRGALRHGHRRACSALARAARQNEFLSGFRVAQRHQRTPAKLDGG